VKIGPFDIDPFFVQHLSVDGIFGMASHCSNYDFMINKTVF
jgi:hypothetical protein